MPALDGFAKCRQLFRFHHRQRDVSMLVFFSPMLPANPQKNKNKDRFIARMDAWRKKKGVGFVETS